MAAIGTGAGAVVLGADRVLHNEGRNEWKE
jgi:hypothetical protein